MNGKIGIVAAMQAEIAPLVRGRMRKIVKRDGGQISVFDSEKLVVAYGGIGHAAAALTATVLVEQYMCISLVSCGLAGALTGRCEVGAVLRPKRIVDASTGVSLCTSSGEGTLVTSDRVLGLEQKRRLAEKYSADAVDMEAAAVAEVAAKAGIPLFAVKAISDSLEFPMPDMDRFISPDGSFAMGKFILHTALRPSSWGAVRHLGRNSSLARRNLCARLQHLIDNEELTPNAINLKHS